MKWQAVWREPSVESVALYPGLVVCDGRVSGSITVSRSRLPLWAFVGWLPKHGWQEVLDSWDYIETKYHWTADKMSEFLYQLLEQRGEFARLLLILADVERRESLRPFSDAWWQKKTRRKRVTDQLRVCLAALEAMSDD